MASASYMLETLHSQYCNLESVWTETTPWNMVVRRWPWSLDHGHILRVVTGSTLYNFTPVHEVEYFVKSVWFFRSSVSGIPCGKAHPNPNCDTATPTIRSASLSSRSRGRISLVRGRSAITGLTGTRKSAIIIFGQVLIHRFNESRNRHRH